MDSCRVVRKRTAQRRRLRAPISTRSSRSTSHRLFHLRLSLPQQQRPLFSQQQLLLPFGLLPPPLHTRSRSRPRALHARRVPRRAPRPRACPSPWRRRYGRRAIPHSPSPIRRYWQWSLPLPLPTPRLRLPPRPPRPRRSRIIVSSALHCKQLYYSSSRASLARARRPLCSWPRPAFSPPPPLPPPRPLRAAQLRASTRN